MTQASHSHRVSLRIPATHPALAGHFPGRPIVPGVVLVDEALRAAEEWLGRPLHIHTIGQIKFTTPLLPEQNCLLELAVETEENRLRFTIRREDDLIVQGTVVVADGSRN
jgi:3-hydroxymyristoyl/3-hydroxydecanoyl-(acyl carrier protein) dehydratase